MKKIKFEYRDEYSHGKFRQQECIVESVDECIKIYALDECEYNIISVEEVQR